MLKLDADPGLSDIELISIRSGSMPQKPALGKVPVLSQTLRKYKSLNRINYLPVAGPSQCRNTRGFVILKSLLRAISMTLRDFNSFL
ncbi:hypothetical protein Baya_3061 [Bagarius yarrelli]|uniref:Uncharacterized protein n=1 Tax=Bagarius yarrelli TaxID=175774 RepID=A0A556TUB3_BAGYA|nr:hypothetical protein Baya_3061 [Bagarius yarrelli]